MSQRGRGRALLALAVGLACFEVLAWATDVPRPTDFWTFTGFVAIAELFEINRPRGIRSTLSPAPALAYVLIGNPPLQGSLVFVGGVAVAVAARTIARRPAALPEIAVHAVAVAGGTAIYSVIAPADPFPTIGPSVSPTGIFGALTFITVVATLAKTALAARRAEVPLWPILHSAVPPLGVIYVVVASLAGLLALAYPSQGLRSIPLLLGPIAATHYAFGRLESAERMYVQTISALSRVPELAGYAAPGHAHQVADLAAAVAREMSVTPVEVEQIEAAALLHEIGLLMVPDPTEEQPVASQAEVAEAGAAVADETRHFPRVAEMIRHQHRPYRARGLGRSPEVPLGAQIIRVVCAYESLRTDGFARSAWEALEHLYLGLTYDYDPSVVQALVRVLERRGEPETGLVHDPTRQRDVERLKEDFVSTVSHELRTPLTPIRGYATLLLQYGDRLPDEQKREALEAILARTEHLGRLVEDLLFASKLAREGERARGGGVRPQSTDLTVAVDRALRSFQVAHPDRAFELESSGPLLALADPPRLGQVLANLLSNAIKFSPSGSPVTVRVERADAQAAIRIRDRGRGIPKDMQEAIFGKFRRLEDPMVMETGGTGLGLYIADQLATAMNGAISVESELGAGSTFTISLPLAAESGAAAAS